MAGTSLQSLGSMRTSVTLHPDVRNEDGINLQRLGERLISRNRHLYSRSTSFTEAPKSSDLLGWFSVSCLIVNRMIGTGIFDGPTTVLQQDHNIGLSLILWALGCLASAAGALMYAEYGLTLPQHTLGDDEVFVARSGGELNYLLYLLPKPPFLVACLLGWNLILVGTSAPNCLAFSLHLLQAMGYEASPTIVRVVAVGTVALVCMIHVLGRKFGIIAGNAFAVVKVLMLCLIIILGLITLHNTTIPREKSSYANLDKNNIFKHIGTGPAPARGYASAFLNIIFTYSGWHQANYVLGEIKMPNRIIGRRGPTTFTLTVVASVVLVGILYMFTNISGVEFPDSFSIASQFFQLTIGRRFGGKAAARIMDAFIAISNLGNVFVTTFTFARVYQEVAKEGVIPYGLVLQRNVDILARLFPGKETDCAPDMALAESNGIFQAIFRIEGIQQRTFDSIPAPSIMLHCLCTWILIFATWGIDHPDDAFFLLSGIYSYNINAGMAVCLGVGILWMRCFSKASSWNRISSVKSKWCSIITVAIVLILNSFPIWALWVPEPLQKLGTTIPWIVVPSVGTGLVVTGIAYWILIRWIRPLFHNGEEFIVKRSPLIVRTREEYRQVAEVIEQSWRIPEMATPDITR
ncbi:amino acid permease-domain-containing protein [Xylogone sp. PMI_703]|nr:amino acid permease-domain-containing protein [Xylogone sp. PMI_703]